MKLSTRSRYGIRMMADLCDQDSEVVTLASISKRQNVSQNYLELVAKDLKRAGYLKTFKGAHGGYKLSKAPETIRIGDLIRLLEGDVQLVDAYPETVSPLQACIKENVFDPINVEIAAYFDAVTLKELCDNKNESTS